MKLIKLNSKKYPDRYVQVDDSDFSLLSMRDWFVCDSGNGRLYAACLCNNRKIVRMHKIITGTVNSNMVVDHIDGNTLNNQRHNLRICSQQQNIMNKRKQSNNVSGYIGVSFCRRDGKWQADCSINGKNHYIGSYSTALMAAIVRDRVVKHLYGEFASLNFK